MKAHTTLTRVAAAPLVASVAGDTITLNGEPLDLAVVSEGEPLIEHGSPWISGAITRDSDGRLHLTLIAPYTGPLPAARWYPAPIVDPEDGNLALPDWEIGAEA